jgi:hypothetical protein
VYFIDVPITSYCSSLSFLRVLDAKMHTLLHTWKSSSGNSGEWDFTLKKQASRLHLTISTGTLKVIAVNTSETLIAVGFSSGVISLLESRTGSLVASWKGGDSDVTSVSIFIFSRDFYKLVLPISSSLSP